MSIIGVIPSLKTPTIDPCAPTLSIASISSANLASLTSSLSGVGTVQGAEATVLNALQVPSLSGLLSGFSVPSISLSLGGLSSSAGISPFAGIVQSLVGKVVSSAINSVESAVLNEVQSVANGVIQQATSAVEKFTAAQLEKDLTPLLNAVSTINGIVGKVEGAKALVSSVLSTASSCPAKAAIMAEAYFKQGAK